MFDVILDALLDTLKIMPLLLVVYILIEVIEANAASRLRLNRILNGKLAPLIGSGVGLIPQCGFSVIATNLYTKRTIRLGTLLAVFIATSDEAVPILLSSPSSALKLLPLLAFKFVFAVTVGYAVNFLYKRELVPLTDAQEHAEVAEIHGCHGHTIAEITDPPQVESDKSVAAQKKEHTNLNVQRYFVHPLLHTLTVLAFILGVNLAMGFLVYFIGETRIAQFMSGAKFFQPFLAGLVGLIPNCASSVVISQLYASGTLTFGAALAGLSVNAGLGFAVLFKQNKNIKENLCIMGGLYLLSTLLGLACSFLPF